MASKSSGILHERSASNQTLTDRQILARTAGVDAGQMGWESAGLDTPPREGGT